MHEQHVAWFWDRVDRNGPIPAHVPDLGHCWVWTRAHDSRGYGQTHLAGFPRRRRFRCHRLAWEIANGAIPDGMKVLHKCDNRLCCRPDHLFLGTDADNVHDMRSKGRARGPLGQHVNVGSRHGRSKLTEVAVVTIRSRLAAGEGISAIASSMNVAYITIYRIARGTHWKHVA